MIIVIFLMIRISASSVKLLPDTQAYQVVPCFRTIFRPIWHVDYGGDHTLAHVFRDMHDVEAMRRAEKLPVWQLLENRPCFPYLHQRLVLLLPLSLLSRLRTIFPVFSNSSTSSLLLRFGIPRVSDLPSNRSPRFLHGSFLPSHLRCAMNTVFDDPGSFSSWR